MSRDSSRLGALERFAYLWRNIFLREASPSTGHNQINEVIAIRSLCNGALDLKSIVRNNDGIFCVESSATLVGEDILKHGYTLVS